MRTASSSSESASRTALARRWPRKRGEGGDGRKGGGGERGEYRVEPSPRGGAFSGRNGGGEEEREGREGGRLSRSSSRGGCDCAARMITTPRPSRGYVYLIPYNTDGANNNATVWGGGATLGLSRPRLSRGDAGPPLARRKQPTLIKNIWIYPTICLNNLPLFSLSLSLSLVLFLRTVLLTPSLTPPIPTFPLLGGETLTRRISHLRPTATPTPTRTPRSARRTARERDLVGMVVARVEEVGVQRRSGRGEAR